MWILPKQLHTSAYVPDTAALISDLDEQSQICARSLFVRSKPSPLRTWLQKWKRDSWTQHLYGRILNPSRGKAFETEWTSLLEVIPANHSPQQGSEQERMTQDTCGLGSQTEFGFCDQESVSLRTLKDISRWDSPASSATWKNWVTKCRGEYSLRVKSAHLTNESGCSSWPTATTRDWKDTGDMTQSMVRKDGKARITLGRVAQANHSTDGSRQESWATPQASDHIEGRRTDLDSNQKCLGRDMKQWATPRANKVHPEITEENREQLATRNKSNLEEEIAGHCGTATGKLNPRWFETLMGLPIGWTMPSCSSPLTIEPTNCDCLETESCQQLPSEHLGLS